MTGEEYEFLDRLRDYTRHRGQISQLLVPEFEAKNEEKYVQLIRETVINSAYETVVFAQSAEYVPIKETELLIQAIRVDMPIILGSRFAKGSIIQNQSHKTYRRLWFENQIKRWPQWLSLRDIRPPLIAAKKEIWLVLTEQATTVDSLVGRSFFAQCFRQKIPLKEIGIMWEAPKDSSCSK